MVDKIWQEQCTAAKNVKERYGIESALAYLVGEKLISFARGRGATAGICAIVARVCRRGSKTFSLREICDHFGKIEQSQVFDDEKYNEEDIDEDLFDHHDRKQEDHHG